MEGPWLGTERRIEDVVSAREKEIFSRFPMILTLPCRFLDHSVLLATASASSTIRWHSSCEKIAVFVLCNKLPPSCGIVDSKSSSPKLISWSCRKVTVPSAFVSSRCSSFRMNGSFDCAYPGTCSSETFSAVGRRETRQLECREKQALLT